MGGSLPGQSVAEDCFVAFPSRGKSSLGKPTYLSGTVSEGTAMTDKARLVPPCECLTWAWVDLPYASSASRHHPKCHHYEGLPFKRIEVDGTFCIVEPHELKSFIGDEDEAVITDVVMSREEFEALPDFEGF